MPFKSFVIDYVNKFLGTYIDNLNASQLKIGWKGEMKFNSLEIKETALDKFNLPLPVKLSFGYVESLVLKIPWKNLYSGPIVVESSDVYVIIVPNRGIVYNDEKSRKNEQEIKQRKLLRLEENRRNRQKSNIPSGDTLTQKLIAQAVKNLQVHIKRVHVRYEDKFSNRERPFSTGITLDSLNFQTTDENFKLIVQREAVKIFYKLVSMNSLSIYWNPKSTLISDLKNKQAIIDALRRTIAVNESKPKGYKYVLNPWTIAAHLKFNQKPESDGSNWTTPKIDLSMELDKLRLAVNKRQYQDMILFLEAQERFTLAEKYLKYRPNLMQYRQHYRECFWWRFAYNCILNEQVKRRRNNWSWRRMKAHRQLVREYRDAWIHFRTHKTPGEAMKEKIEEAEDALDVFNLNIARQQAEFEIDKHLDLVRVEDQQQEGWVGWAKNWWLGGSPKSKEEEAAALEDAQIFEELEKELTPEEKERLFDAIDYQENMPPTDYPKHFVENMFTLNLKMLMLKLDTVVEMRFSQLSSKLEQRSSANAMRFTSTVKSLEMHSGTVSMLHMTETDRAWLTMEFETNPLKGSFDHRLSLDVAPVMFKYHAPAVNRVLNVFKSPKSVHLHQLTTLALARYEDVKARSASALQNMLVERKKLKLEVKIDPATFVVSAGGAFDPTKMTLIAELGKLQLNTLDEPSTKAYEHITDQKLRSLMARRYDNFQLCLTDLRLIFSDSFVNCMKARQNRSSDDHLLKPTRMRIDMLRATIDDVQIPMFHLVGELPDIVFTISDDRLFKLLEFVSSIPRPDFVEEEADLSTSDAEEITLRDRAKMEMLLATDELPEETLQTVCFDAEAKKAAKLKKALEEKRQIASHEQQVQLDLNLQLNEIGIVVKRRGCTFLSARIQQLVFHLCKRMFDLEVSAHMDAVAVRASPAAVGFLSAIHAKLMQHQQNEVKQLESVRSMRRDYSNYWIPKQIERPEYWWFRPPKSTGGLDAINLTKDAEAELKRMTERAEFSIRRCLITVEAGRDVTRPMILIESSIAGTARNWSSSLTAKCEASLLVSYYNETFNVWEPVIEPVLHEGRGWQNWKLAVKIGPQEDDKVEQSSKIPSTSKQKKNDASGGDAKKSALPAPKLAVVIEAAEMLNITVTKSFLQQLGQLSDALENAAKQIGTPRRQLPGTSSHLLRNDTGLDIIVSSTTSIKVVSSANAGRVQCVGGLYILMESVNMANSNLKTNWRMEEDQRQIQLQLSFAGTERTVNIARMEKQCVDLPWKSNSGRKQSFVVETMNEDARHVVTLKSVVTVLNHLEMPVEIQALHNSKCLPCGIAQSNSIEPLNIPVPCLNTPNGLLQIRPADGRHDWSKENFSWLNFSTTKRQAVRCDNTKTGKGIFIEIVVVDEPIQRSHRRFDTDSVAFTVHLFAPIHFINTLPMPVKISVPIKCELAGGEAVDIMNAVAGCRLIFAIEIGIEEYELCYTLPTVKKSLETVRLKGKSNTNAKLFLGLNWSTEFLRSNLKLYAPYWMVNETGKQLAYKRIQGRCPKCLRPRNHAQREAAAILHPPDKNPLILPLSFKREFESKNRAKVKIVGVTGWSPSFPLDVAGNSGSLICKTNVRGKRKREFEMTVDVQLCQSGLTKVVTISPFFLLKNDSNFDIEVREPHTLKWLLVAADSVIGFWPMQKERRKTLVARYSNTEEESVQFPFTEAFEGFCQIKNDLMGLYVTVSLSDESSVVNMESFGSGMVPAILMNDTAHPIHYRQECDSHWHQIKPNQLVPFAWSDSMNDCKLEWRSGDAANSEELLRNRNITYLPSKTDGPHHYCVSFLDARQRILLFTADANVAFIAHQEYEMEQPDIDLELHLHGVGISVVNNHKSVELLYMAISPHRPQKLKKGAKLSTTMNTGFWCKYRQTAHMQKFHVKLQHFQVGNQLPASTFRSMLAMVPQPKSVVKNDPKPFLECSFVMSQPERTNIVRLKLLMQEFAIRLDRALINELLDMMLKERIQQTGYTPDSFHIDMELTKDTLDKRAMHARVTQAKTYYQRLHISPLMIHLSFSQGIAEEETDEAIHSEFANLILKSIGVTVTEIQDVVFKLAYFQRNACFYSRTQLQSEIQAHYFRQFIKQLYVLVFGLDILGNPFRLVRDLRTGAVDLFYQPVLGMVTGPAEFGEGVYIGLTSAFRHTVCGVLGLTSRITGTMGKGVAALTMDEDFQRRRMLAGQSTSIATGMFRGLSGVGTGLVEGVTGVLSKPVEGVMQGGVLGGIKGIGVGMVGVIARPVSGVVDLITTTTDNVRNAISNLEDINRIRPPRVIFRDKIIRPYVWEEAAGFEIFRETEHGQMDADHFLTYGAITKRWVIIVTDKHVIESRKHILTENWSAAWRLAYAELERPVRVNVGGKFGIELRLNKKKKGGFSLCSKGAGANRKLVQFSAEDVAQRVFDYILRAWESGAEE